MFVSDLYKVFSSLCRILTFSMALCSRPVAICDDVIFTLQGQLMATQVSWHGFRNC